MSMFQTLKRKFQIRKKSLSRRKYSPLEDFRFVRKHYYDPFDSSLIYDRWMCTALALAECDGCISIENKNIIESLINKELNGYVLLRIYLKRKVGGKPTIEDFDNFWDEFEKKLENIQEGEGLE